MRGARRTWNVLQPVVVPAIFAIVCVSVAWKSGLSPTYIATEVLIRLGRNGFLVLSLIIPIVAGLGLNFAIVVGAMAGQAGLIMITAWGVTGLPGVGLAALLALPIALVLGWLMGLLFNLARGKEMITGLMAGFFAAAPYQLIFLFAIGSLIPLSNAAMVLPGPLDEVGRPTPGVGLRNTIDLVDVQHALDRTGEVEIHLEDKDAADRKVLGRGKKALGYKVIKLPLGVFGLIGLLCVFTVLFLRTKLGQQFRAMGQDSHVAEVHGIRVSRNRILATMISIVLAAWGQIIFLQNMGNMVTYNAHEMTGLYAIAALLVSGASATRATWWQALLGVVLFHSLWVVLPPAGARLFPEHADIGEYIRSAFSYGIVLVALIMHALRRRGRRA